MRIARLTKYDMELGKVKGAVRRRARRNKSSWRRGVLARLRFPTSTRRWARVIVAHVVVVVVVVGVKERQTLQRRRLPKNS